MKTINDYRNKKVLVLGLAKSGTNAAILLHKLGALVTVNDKKKFEDNVYAQKLVDMGIRVIAGYHPLELLDEDFELMVKNPGISYDNPMVKKAMEKHIPIITEPELAYEVSEAPFTCITGTNGKTTTTTLIQMIVDQERKAGHAYKAGNIGIPVSEVVEKATPQDDIIMEISSFQLLGITKLHPHVAVLTNIYESHLDYHKTMENYINAKMNITKNQTPDDYFVINYDKDWWRDLAKRSKAKIVPFSRLDKSEEGAYEKDGVLYFRGEKVIDADEIVLPGQHNIENCLAAIAVAKIFGKSNEAIKNVFTTFKGVKHRIQYIETKDNRKIYNDSKATNIEATTVALNSFKQPTVLIAGGLDRGFKFDELVKPMKNVKAIILYGETKNLMKDAAEKAGIKEIKLVDNLDQAVPEAWKASKPGDVILLSPAAASWDQFDNFEQRGDRFIDDINKLGD